MGAGLAAQLAPCPAGTRLLMALYAATSGSVAVLAASGGPGLKTAARLQLHFLCSLTNVMKRKYFWAALTSMFYRPLQDGMDIIMAVVELQLAAEHLAEREHALGSTRFLAWSALTATCANAVFLVMMKALSSSANGVASARFTMNQGLWPIVSVCMTLKALDAPHTMVKVLGIAEVPSRWYPLSFALAVSALRGSMQWDMLAPIACGHFFRVLPLEDMLVLKRRTASAWERRRRLQWLPRLLSRSTGGAWIPAEDPNRHGWFGAYRVDDEEDDGRRRQRPVGGGGGGERGNGHNFRLFGGEGRRLGD